MRQRVWLVATSAALALSATACAGSDGDSAGSATPDQGIVTVLTDFRVKPAETEATAGKVTFDLRNDGPSDHTFYLVKTDLAEDALPVEHHTVRLEGLEVVGEVEELEFDSEESLTVDLAAGTYVLFCNLPGHYESDMHTAFTVA